MTGIKGQKSGTNPNSWKNLNKKGKHPWNYGLKGKEYLNHYKNGHPRGMKGKRPWNFVDGSSNQRRFMLREWILVAKKCYKRDNYICQGCRKQGGLLNAHHIIPWSISKDDSLENLITLCVSCHKKIHKNDIKRDKKGRWIKKE